MIHPIFEKIFSPFIVPAQKTAQQIQDIPKDTNIYVLSWSDIDRLGWFTTELHYKWWEDGIGSFVKEWTPWDFSDFVNEVYTYDKGPDFWEWWHDRHAKVQEVIVSEFIRAHEPMLRKEMDEYYNNVQNLRSC